MNPSKPNRWTRTAFSAWTNTFVCGLLSLCTMLLAAPVWPQSRALPSGDVQAIYRRLLKEIESIKIFDHHAHPGFGDDSDVDAQATPPQHLPFRERDSNPELVVAVKALFDYPYSDMSDEHMRWLQEKSRAAEKAGGVEYWDRILDRCGIEASVANQIGRASCRERV